jgi:hypothetical protein
MLLACLTFEAANASLNAAYFRQSRHAALATGQANVNEVWHYTRQTIFAIAAFMAVLDCLE